MRKLRNRRAFWSAIAATAFLIAGAVVAAQLTAANGSAAKLRVTKELREPSQGEERGGAGSESAEELIGSQQWDEARSAPGIVAPGGYSAAYGQLQSLAVAGGSWSELTKRPYDADDPDYRDYYSNSSGGSGLVTGRVTGLAADPSGYVYAGGADGGVWRSSTGGGNWTPIADTLPSLSTGDLQLDPSNGSLWYATGEANTGGTSYVGTGVYRITDPKTQSFTPSTRVGGQELESTTINAIRFAPTKVWIATLRGIWWHSRTGDMTTPWTFSFAPNPSYLPGGPNAGDANAPYKNIVNDLAIDPKNANHLVAAVGWRSGEVGNGFYETTDGGQTWNRINPTGGIDATDIGNATFAFSGDGKKLYLMNQSPRKINSGAAVQNTYLDGIYASSKGLTGPWNKIASSDNLGNAESGSALASNFGIGYSPGVQSWYNQFLLVDPADSNHVFAGLEEVYETKDGGNHWLTVGPYWNFYFSCWAPDAVYPPNGTPNRCPQTTHPDQHSVAIGKSGGQTWLYVGNDGGVYKRPLNGQINANNNATDWQSLNDGTMDALQYYAVDIGTLQSDDAARPDLGSGDNVLVSGGLQDNGGSLLRPGASKMVSNFGGDGGDVLVDPADGCNIVQEYVFLSMEVTKTCANPGPDHPNAFLDKTDATTVDIAPPDVNARFIAPFTANETNIDEWLAGGNSLWYQDQGFDISSPAGWQKVYTFGPAARVATAVAFRGNKAIAGYCGPCNNAGFTRGVVVGTKSGSGWSFQEIVGPASPAIPNRYVAGAAIDAAGNLYVVMNGFSRRFTEGPGAGVGHVFRSTDNGATWTDISGNFPDVPANSIEVLPSGGLVVGTDLGVVYKAASSSTWKRLGGNFPTTVAIDVERGPDGNIYAATHGRGIWRISGTGL
jgi:hypothetical protein